MGKIYDGVPFIQKIYRKKLYEIVLKELDFFRFREGTGWGLKF